jgi:Uma2 family endonuclease
MLRDLKRQTSTTDRHIVSSICIFGCYPIIKALQSNPSRILTLEEFLQLEETTHPCELINGELIMSPVPSPIHQEVAGLLHVLFFNAAAVAGGKVYHAIGLFINQHNCLEPDLVYISS